uniref:oxaloacetate tautomerase n=1 Tax=Cacopsylla melanoneura TaxID=428564 RepID=A0A8D9BDH0_9HEMI
MSTTRLSSQCALGCLAVYIVAFTGVTGLVGPAMGVYNFGEFALRCRKIVGAGLNYKKILKERNLLPPKEPVVFLKPPSSIIQEPKSIEIPERSEVHHEVELGVIIGRNCKNVDKYDAMKCIAGYCLALDLTEVTHLKTARETGLPWTIGKGFDTACPVSLFIPAHEIRDPDDVPLWLSVNGEERQKSSTGDMLFKTGELISYISRHMTLEPYDLVLTGTPSGTGPIKHGDVIEAGLGKDLVHVRFEVKNV